MQFTNGQRVRIRPEYLADMRARGVHPSAKLDNRVGKICRVEQTVSIEFDDLVGRLETAFENVEILPD